MQAALVILDGWGLGDHDRRDAVRAAATPAFDRLAGAGAAETLDAAGRHVGLPDGRMGNSEVGHLTIGAGRVVEQAAARIDDAVAAGTLGDNEAVAGAFDHAAEAGGRVHFAGLVSDGGVHSDQAHLHALLELAADRGTESVTHAFTDGRDTAPTAGSRYLGDLSAVVDRHGTGHVATVTGRYYAMDRDQNWGRTRRAYDAIARREADHEAPSARAAVEAAYDRGETDEFVEPTLVTGGDGPADPRLRAGDALLCFNFRGDRARQLVRMLGDVDPEWPFATDPPPVHVVTLTEYDGRFDFPVAFPPIRPEGTLGEAVADAGLTQLRVAESEKYPHVTYFLNGGREVEFDGERRRILASPDVATYDLAPEMSAAAVTDAALGGADADGPDLLVVNYANPDMVGHTGDFDAAVTAVEAVDAELGRLAAGVRAAGGALLLTADHGNADDMGTPEEPHTAHTTNPVPVVYVAPDGSDGGHALRGDGALRDVAPTLLTVLGVEHPAGVTGESLLDERE